jgi:uncharacterized protein
VADVSSSALFVGTVRHRRRRPTDNAFRYPVHHLLLDVDELERLDARIGGFAYNRAGIVSFHDVDHLGPARRPVRRKLADWLEGHGVELPDGPVRVLTSPRVLGYVFNPVSWWFCHHRDGTLAFVVAEVCNTFGESHSYLLDDLEARPDGALRAQAEKVFHVSPFLAVADHRYDFVIRPPGDRALVHMEVSDPDGVVLDATQDERRRELTTASLWRALLAQPHVPLHAMVRIHLQALRLWWRRVPFHRKPEPPPNHYPRPDQDASDEVGARRAPVRIATPERRESVPATEHAKEAS